MKIKNIPLLKVHAGGKKIIFTKVQFSQRTLRGSSASSTRSPAQPEEEKHNAEGELGAGVHFIYTGELAKFLICRIFLSRGRLKTGKLAGELTALNKTRRRRTRVAFKRTNL